MARVVRLETVVTLTERREGFASYSARHDAVLDDGSRIVLLDDRGWSGQTRGPKPWPAPSREEIAHTARTVVGPDEPPTGRGWSAEHMQVTHWETLSSTLAAHGVTVPASELRAMPHEVVIA